MPPAEAIDLCLESLDSIKICMSAFIEHKKPRVDLNSLYLKLDQAIAGELPASKHMVVKTTAKTSKNKVAMDKQTKKSDPTKVAKSESKVEPIEQKSAEPKPVQKNREADTAKVKKTTNTQPSEGTLRVAVEKIDQLIALGENMQVARIEIGQNIAELQQLNDEIIHLSEALEPLKVLLKPEPKKAGGEKLRDSLIQVLDSVYEIKDNCGKLQIGMRSYASDLGFVSSELNHSLYSLRLVSASTLMQGITRSVRDIARELGKKVAFHVSGDDIEMDRIVLNDLKSPLLHLIRNAIDHGIEFPDDRIKAGKTEAGLITISLNAVGSEVNLTVTDDGHGIDIQKVSDAAVRKKLLLPDELETMNNKSILDLIFHPGFSTREIITDVSGRGVGLDVVRTTLTNIKGRVSVETVLNEGSSFQLFLPRMLTTERGLVIKVSGDTYVIPSTSVDRVLSVHADEIIKVDCNEAVLIDERAVPIRHLAHVLNLSSGKEIEKDHELSLVIIRKGAAAVAFLVDEVVHEREIVIKSLEPPLNAIANVMGATVSATLGVMMVLNANALLDLALSGESGISLSHKESGSNVSEQKILVVDDSITTRTLEKSVLESRGYNTTLAVDGRQAWDILQSQSFDLIITDIEMPIMNGFELTSKIKTDATHKETPVIIVTSLANDADKKRGVDAGANAYIVKSQFESKALLALIEQLI